MKWAAGILLMAAWITPSEAAAPDDLAAYQALAQQDLRLATIGYRLAQANAPFCDRKILSPGWVLHDEAQYPDKGLAKTAFVFRSPVAISSVVSGGDAAQLGLQPGDGIAAIDGIDVTGPIAVKTRRATANSPATWAGAARAWRRAVMARMARARSSNSPTPWTVCWRKRCGRDTGR